MLQHSPLRRSPRLKGDSVTSEPSDGTQPVSSAASGTQTTTQARDAVKIKNVTSTPPVQMQPASTDDSKTATSANAKGAQQTQSVSKPPASHSKVSTPVQTLPKTSSTSVLEMQKHIAMLQRQLSDAQVKLSDSNRQCQELQSAIQRKDQVSDHNLKHVSASQSTISAIDQPPPTTFALHYISQPTNTSTTYTAAMSCMQTASMSSSIAALPTQAAQTSNDSLVLPSFCDTNTNMPSMQTAPTITNRTNTPTQAAPAFNHMYVSPATNNPIPPFWELSQQPSTANTIPNSTIMPRKTQDLPDFCGDPEDWPLFYTAFTQSTAAYGYTNLENNQRLQKCLKGNAREVIKSLLIHPDNVDAVIEQLKFRFGRPEQLIHSQLRQVRDLPQVSENNLVKLVPFSTKVKNLAVFLQSVNGQQHIANPTLLEELIAKLPMSKKLDWARTAASIQPYPTIIDFSNWLSDVANLICSVQEVDQKDQKRRVLLHTTTANQPKCPICQNPHKIYDCDRFLNMNTQDRWKEVKRIRACFSCLNVGHTTRECRRKKTCSNNGCQRKHNKLLHENTPCDPSSTLPCPTNQPQENVLSCSAKSNNKLLFRVLPVTLYGKNCHMDIYALFDDGSSITMLDREVADKIGVHGKNCPLNIQWFGGRSACEPAISFNVKISGSNRKSCHLLKDVYAVSNLNLPMQSLTHEEIEKVFKGSPHLPVKPYTNVVPKLLIGLDHAFLGLPSITNNNNMTGPFACNTELGWVVFGPCHRLSPIQQSCLFVNVKRDVDLHQIVTDYFNVENMGVRAAPIVESDEDVRAKRILNESTRKVGDRFQTGLLWKYDEVSFPNSYSMALKRLEGIEKKMKRDPVFSKAYKEVMQGYIDKGYVRKLSSDDIKVTSFRKWYLPHFGVTNPNKPNKLRLVFDAAASVQDISLNSQLLKGPQDIASLPSTLYNFRRGQIAVGADIREMFHQILVQPCDRISQRFLWRDGNTANPPYEYEMVVMTFGAACSPSSALYVMKTNARDHRAFHPRAIEAICDHHYMDDFVDSFDSVEEAVSISKQVREIHKNGGFELRGFISNSDEVITTLDGSLISKQIPANDGTERVLGLFWEPSSDNFMFNLKFHRVDKLVMSGQRSPTKREVLSIIMSTFDPLGYLSHFTVGGKLLLRQIWKSNCLWDEPIPNALNSSWKRWRSQMNNIANFRVRRFYFSFGKPTSLQLHIFVDASEEAFAAIAYWRYIGDGDICTSFIISKTKCSPLKRVTIPRLELQAAVLGTRLKQNILSEHSLVPDKCVLWSDSKTVLKWIASNHRRYKPYVAHRVAEILASTDVENWRWVSTKDNVADEATRSSNNVDFSSSSRWLNGPAFLKLPEEDWTKGEIEISKEVDEEEISQKMSLIIINDNMVDFNRFSSLCRLKRSFAWVLRFINHCRKEYNVLQKHGLTSREVEYSEKLLCQLVQREAFPDELKLIKNKLSIPKTCHLYNLMPYVDDDGLLRVYGRIDAASYLPYSSRRPIILPKIHNFTKLVVMHYHCQMMHQNHEATICEVRKKFWIPQLRSLLKTIVSNCQQCKIKNANPQAPIMGPLPFDRLEPNIEPFKYTGLDYFGPINVSIGRRTEKRWVALFTCLTLRAIHLELAYDLSTDSCIIVIRNFINRRGIPARIRSDNGKNFIGANEEARRFSEVFDAKRIQNEMSMKGIEWIFNCPVNPSEGGIWERMVQCVKKVLRHTLKQISPKEHVLHSLLIEAENVVNSRPLTHLPISPHEEEPLTPNHFLIGSGNVANTPSVESPDIKPFTLKKQWRVSRCLRDRFWKKWVNEYLPTLTRRVKWCERTVPIKVGDLVFICDPNVPRSQWRKGLVTCVYAGPDGVARRVDVKTSTGKLQRAVSKLAVLDVESGEADSSTGAGVFQNDPECIS
ncbi:uncharacterized protein LOC135955477 [Calliphora vicina]|uniref:uncharacterized protein LOC135955477 n=1 Tax=Calliphora vicina TaxID=7373 RepID=UPI00325AE6DE